MLFIAIEYLEAFQTLFIDKKVMMKKSTNPQNDNFANQYGFSMIFKADEKYYFQFNDRAGEPLLFSKGYNTEKSCKEGMKAIIRAAKVNEQYELNETKKGKRYFTLKSINQKETCRSRMFDTQEELEEQIELLKGIDETVPQYGVMNTAAEIKMEPPLENAKANKDIETKPITTKVTDKQPSEPEDTEKMPRYKFSVIFYPDSKVWMVKNDFSGDSSKMNHCDGQKIETFIKSQFPMDELEVLPVPIKAEVIPQKETIPSPKKTIVQEVELVLRTHEGKLIEGFAGVGSIGKVDLTPKLNEDTQTLLSFDAKVMAKSLENNQTVLIGMVNNQCLVNGQLSILISGGHNINKGPYRFSVALNQTDQGEVYYASKLVMMK